MMIITKYLLFRSYEIHKIDLAVIMSLERHFNISRRSQIIDIDSTIKGTSDNSMAVIVESEGSQWSIGSKRFNNP
jgi:hypothetical protein